eukprot:1157883-Pelagomonas_calceolata.AAC.1
MLRLTPPPAWTHTMLAHLAGNLQSAPLSVVTFTLSALSEGWGEGLSTDPGASLCLYMRVCVRVRSG